MPATRYARCLLRHDVFMLMRARKSAQQRYASALCYAYFMLLPRAVAMPRYMMLMPRLLILMRALLPRCCYFSFSILFSSPLLPYFADDIIITSLFLFFTLSPFRFHFLLRHCRRFFAFLSSFFFRFHYAITCCHYMIIFSLFSLLLWYWWLFSLIISLLLFSLFFILLIILPLRHFRLRQFSLFAAFRYFAIFRCLRYIIISFSFDIFFRWLFTFSLYYFADYFRHFRYFRLFFFAFHWYYWLLFLLSSFHTFISLHIITLQLFDNNTPLLITIGYVISSLRHCHCIEGWIDETYGHWHTAFSHILAFLHITIIIDIISSLLTLPLFSLITRCRFSFFLRLRFSFLSSRFLFAAFATSPSFSPLIFHNIVLIIISISSLTHYRCQINIISIITLLHFLRHYIYSILIILISYHWFIISFTFSD